MRYETRQSSIMLFQTRKAWRTGAPRFLTHDAKGPWQNWILPRPLFPCPICAQRRPRITKSSGSCSRARLGTCQNAPRGFLPSHGLPPTMAAFRRKAAQLQIQLRGKPRTLTGFLLIPPPRSAAARGTMIRCMLLYVQNTTPGSNCQCLFPSLPLFCNRPPKNPHREPPRRRQAPKGGGCGCKPAPV